jgi:hypothetical protein
LFVPHISWNLVAGFDGLLVNNVSDHGLIKAGIVLLIFLFIDTPQID